MPIHEYQCPKCQTQFEEITFGKNIPPCPLCGEKNIERLISRTCIHKEHHSSEGQSVSSGGRCGGCSGGNCSTCK